jgi:hypothetical protein
MEWNELIFSYHFLSFNYFKMDKLGEIRKHIMLINDILLKEDKEKKE